MIKTGLCPGTRPRHPASCLPTFPFVPFHKPRARASHFTVRGSMALGRGVRTAPEPRQSSPRVASSGRDRGRGARLPGVRGQVHEARAEAVQVAQRPIRPLPPAAAAKAFAGEPAKVPPAGAEAEEVAQVCEEVSRRDVQRHLVPHRQCRERVPERVLVRAQPPIPRLLRHRACTPAAVAAVVGRHRRAPGQGRPLGGREEGVHPHGLAARGGAAPGAVALVAEGPRGGQAAELGVPGRRVRAPEAPVGAWQSRGRGRGN